MAFFVNEQKMVEENTFQYEDKIKSPTARLIDTNQTYCIYYHINIDETTTDEGFKDVASIIGHRSPIRFNRIEDFPIYGMDQIVLQLQDSDQGLDTSYESEAIILPGTIKPVQNDFFIIPTLKDSYIFRVTDIQYDNIMPDNFYKINFKLEYIDGVKLEELNKQIVSDNICVLENIGTENRCIIEKKEFVEIQEIEKMYREIVSFYKAMFYNDRHNVFLCPHDGYYIYDPLQTEFINKHNLFNEKNNFQVIILTDQYDDPKRKLKYNKSLYKFIESKRLELLTRFPYIKRSGISVKESSFNRWHDTSVNMIDIPIGVVNECEYIFSEEFVDAIKYNSDIVGDYANLIQRYLREKELKLSDIPLTLDDELIYMNDCLEVFFFTPVIMYIIKDTINHILTIKK